MRVESLSSCISPAWEKKTTFMSTIKQMHETNTSVWHRLFFQNIHTKLSKLHTSIYLVLLKFHEPGQRKRENNVSAVIDHTISLAAQGALQETNDSRQNPYQVPAGGQPP